MFWKILQISVESTCVACLRACNFIKKRLQRYKNNIKTCSKLMNKHRDKRMMRERQKILIMASSKWVRIYSFVLTKMAFHVSFCLHLRPCQIDFLFSVTRGHAKKLGSLNLFIKKLARLSFLFIIGEKRILFIYFNFNHFLF